MANLTTKELSLLEDQLSIEKNVISKYRMYAQTTTDPVLKSKCDDIANRHQRHFDTLMSQLG